MKRGVPTASRNPLVRLQQRFEAAFETFRQRYRQVLETLSPPPACFSWSVFFVACLGSLAILIPWLGQDFFPNVDAECSSFIFARQPGCALKTPLSCAIWLSSRSAARSRPNEVSSIIDNIGLPYSGINLSYSNSAPVGTSDADILVTLISRTISLPTTMSASFARSLPKQFPGVMFSLSAFGYGRGRF